LPLPDFRHRQVGISELTFSVDQRLVKQRLPLLQWRERHGNRQKNRICRSLLDLRAKNGRSIQLDRLSHWRVYLLVPEMIAQVAERVSTGNAGQFACTPPREVKGSG
jgi:hypothetical protein